MENTVFLCEKTERDSKQKQGKIFFFNGTGCSEILFKIQDSARKKVWQKIVGVVHFFSLKINVQNLVFATEKQ